jgi:NADPH:quinone reductase-like Zn-dependent oxidoreductase
VQTIIRTRYGTPEVLEHGAAALAEPGPGQLRVRVEAAGINPYDWHAMVGLPLFVRAQFGWRRPRVRGLGADFAGVVDAVGPGVDELRPGDAVYGQVDGLPGSRLLALGAVASHVVVSQEWIRARPPGLAATAAAGVPLAGMTALRAIRDEGRVGPGDRVLINGASGGVGTLAVQIAVARGATVTGVCSTTNLDLVRSLGAAEVIDYTRNDPTVDTGPFDLVLDNVGNHPPAAWRRALATDGLYLASFDHPERRWLGPMRQAVRMIVGAKLTGRRMRLLQLGRRTEDLDDLTDLLASGAVRPVVCCTFPLDQTREAMEHLASRRARGKIVITVGDAAWDA